MDHQLPRFQKATLVLGAAFVTLLCRPFPMHAQSSTPQDTQAVPSQGQQQAQQAVQNQNQQTNQNQDRQANPDQDRQARSGDDITRGDLARFDQFLDSHREIAEQLRRTPSLVDDPQFLQSHPALSTYLQDHPSVKQEVSAQPDTFLRLERQYNRDATLRDRDADGHGQVREVGGQEGREQDRDAGQNRDIDHRDDADRRDVPDHRDDADRRDVARFNQFLDSHREVAEQVRRDPSLLDNRIFVQNHPALQSFLQDNPGVRDQLRQNPNAFIRQEEAYNHELIVRDRDRDPAHNRMADFGGFLHDHSDIQRDLSRDPSVVKDHDYMQNHAELDAYLKAHPEMRDDLMSNPQNFVQGARQYDSGASSGSGVNAGRGTSTTGSGTGTTGSGTAASTSTAPTSTSTKPATQPHQQQYQ